MESRRYASHLASFPRANSIVPRDTGTETRWVILCTCRSRISRQLDARARRAFAESLPSVSISSSRSSSNKQVYFILGHMLHVNTVHTTFRSRILSRNQNCSRVCSALEKLHIAAFSLLQVGSALRYTVCPAEMSSAALALLGCGEVADGSKVRRRPTQRSVGAARPFRSWITACMLRGDEHELRTRLLILAGLHLLAVGPVPRQLLQHRC